MRRVRSDSRLAALPEAVREEALAMDARREPLRNIRAWLLEQGHRFALSSISDWLQGERVRRFGDRLRTATSVASEVATDARGAAGAAVDDAIIAGVKELTLDLVLRQGADPKDLQGLLGLVLKSQKQDLEARRVRLLEEKAEAHRILLARVAAEAKAGGISDEALEEVERRAKIL